MTKDEALKLALQLVSNLRTHSWTVADEQLVITAIKEALAQPEQEPVQWGVDWGKAGETPCVSIIKRKPNGGIEVVAVEYGPPPQHTWVGLTDEEVNKFVDDEDWYNFPHEFAKAVEAKLKEKNK